MKRLLLVLVCWSPATVLGDNAVPAPNDGVPCQTVDDCWLGPGGVAIRRPRRFRKKPFPRGDCGANLHWLANRLTCEAGRCVVTHVGDRC